MDTSAIFQSRLPRRPYCSNNLEQGLTIRPAATALHYRHLQPNAPLEVAWLMFDLDYPDAASAWKKSGLPPPTLAVSNPENGHSHLFYGLTTPVGMSDTARAAPIRYAAALQAAFLAKLCADPGYAGLIAKNPFHAAWLAQWTQHLYDLGELANYVTLPKRLPKRSEHLGLGRNCTLFDELRSWAYQWVREYQDNGASSAQWHEAVLRQAEKLNAFEVPLAFNEIKAVAKSVARWTWVNFSDAAFSALQSARGKRGGRPKTTTKDGVPWEAAGMSRSAYYRQLKSGLLVPTSTTYRPDTVMSVTGETKAISDNSIQPLPAGDGGRASTTASRPDTHRDNPNSQKSDAPTSTQSRQTGTQVKAPKVKRDTTAAEAKAWAYWEACHPGTQELWHREWERRKNPSLEHSRSVIPWHWPPLLLEEPDVMTADGPIPYIEHMMRCLESNLRVTGRRVPWTSETIEKGWV